jgi:hypothetical protein
MAKDKPVWISTPENAATIQGLLDQRKRVLVLAPRRSGKTTLIRLLDVDCHVTSGQKTAELARENSEGSGAMLRRVVTIGELTCVKELPAVIAFDEFEVFPKVFLDPFIDTSGPKLFIGTPLNGDTFADDDRFDACFKWY